MNIESISVLLPLMLNEKHLVFIDPNNKEVYTKDPDNCLQPVDSEFKDNVLRLFGNSSVKKTVVGENVIARMDEIKNKYDEIYKNTLDVKE